MKNKIAIFVSTQNPLPSQLVSFFKEKNYYFVKSDNPDEIDQAGRQSEIGVILVFDDPKLAYRYLQENRWDGFAMMKILYLQKRMNVSSDAEKKLSQMDLQVIVLGEESLLSEKMTRFENRETDTIDIKFAIHDQLEKKV